MKDKKIKWLALKDLKELEKEVSMWPSYVLRIKIECGKITDTAQFTTEEKRQNKIYCYTHQKYENIMGAGKIKLIDSIPKQKGNEQK